MSGTWKHRWRISGTLYTFLSLSSLNVRILVSFVVVALFKRVSILESKIDLTKQAFPIDLTQIAENFLKVTFLFINGKYNELTDGSVMGSPISPINACLINYGRSWKESSLIMCICTLCRQHVRKMASRKTKFTEFSLTFTIIK